MCSNKIEIKDLSIDLQKKQIDRQKCLLLSTQTSSGRWMWQEILWLFSRNRIANTNAFLCKVRRYLMSLLNCSLIAFDLVFDHKTCQSLKHCSKEWHFWYFLWKPCDRRPGTRRRIQSTFCIFSQSVLRYLWFHFQSLLLPQNEWRNETFFAHLPEIFQKELSLLHLLPSTEHCFLIVFLRNLQLIPLFLFFSLLSLNTWSESRGTESLSCFLLLRHRTLSSLNWFQVAR